MAHGYQCGFCGSWNEVVVDPSGGPLQSYTEDCQVCCRANVLHLTYDPEVGEFSLFSELE